MLLKNRGPVKIGQLLVKREEEGIVAGDRQRRGKSKRRIEGRNF